MRKLCIFHSNCADGFGAAWVVRKALGEDVEFHAGIYQNPPPDVTGRDVILVDFSYKRDVIYAMLGVAKSILIIDHHKTAIDDLSAIDATVANANNLQVHFDVDHSGAMLAWLHYFPNEIAPPRLLEHIEDRDLWKFKLDGTREIQLALFSYPYDFEVWDNLMAMDVSDLCQDGKALARKHHKDISEYIDAAAGRMILAGYDVPALNCPYCWSSDAGHIMAQGEPFAICYHETPAGQIISMRSAETGIDVSEIAKHHGGGGHKHAAAFKLPPGKFLSLNPKK